MWTDLGFNVILLLMSDYVFVLAASNVGYIIFNFLNLHRVGSTASTARTGPPLQGAQPGVGIGALLAS
jgi:hypothetical protein